MRDNAQGNSGHLKNWRQMPGWEKPKPKIEEGMVLLRSPAIYYSIVKIEGKKVFFYETDGYPSQHLTAVDQAALGDELHEQSIELLQDWLDEGVLVIVKPKV